MLEALEKAGINGIVTSAASVALFGTQAKIVAPFTDMTMPLYAYMFLGGLASSFLTDGLHTFMKDEIPLSKKANDRVSLVTGLAVNAVVFAGLLQVVDSSIATDFGRLSALAVGAGAEWVAASGYSYLKDSHYL